MGMSFNLRVGQRVIWHDPDGETCSGKGTIVEIKNDLESDIIDEETIICVQKDDGGEVEALPMELECITR